jgi:hypothetical protein
VARVKVKLIGLIEPVDESARAAFEEWYLGNHVQDVSHTPGIVSATVHRMVKSFSSDDPPEYVTIYEFDSPQQGDAEEALFSYLRKPTWPGSKRPNGSMKIISAGWYEVERSFVGGQEVGD